MQIFKKKNADFYAKSRNRGDVLWRQKCHQNAKYFVAPDSIRQNERSDGDVIYRGSDAPRTEQK